MPTLMDLPKDARVLVQDLPVDILGILVAATPDQQDAKHDAYLGCLVRRSWSKSPLVGELLSRAFVSAQRGLPPGWAPDAEACIDRVKRGLRVIDEHLDRENEALAKADLWELGRRTALGTRESLTLLPWDTADRRALDTLHQVITIRWGPPSADDPRRLLSAQELAALRHKVDAYTAEVIERCFAEGHRADLNALLGQLNSDHSIVPEALSPEMLAYLDRSSELPFWADPRKIVAGQELFVRHAPLMVLMLFLSALPRMYTLRDGVQVLAMSQQLSKNVNRRVVETAQFLIDVLTPEGLILGGRGVRTLQKVRLIHASVSRNMRKSPAWDLAWGEPINLQDQLSVALQLSVGVLEAMKGIGVDFTAEEEDAFAHVWSVVAYMLGVEEQSLPKSGAEATQLWNTLNDIQVGATPEGVQLTRDLLDYMVELLGGAEIMRTLASAMIVEHLGPETAACIGVQAKPWVWRAIRPLMALAFFRDRIGDHVRVVAKVQQIVGVALLKQLVRVNSEGRPVEFLVPETLWRHAHARRP